MWCILQSWWLKKQTAAVGSRRMFSSLLSPLPRRSAFSSTSGSSSLKAVFLELAVPERHWDTESRDGGGGINEPQGKPWELGAPPTPTPQKTIHIFRRTIYHIIQLAGENSWGSTDVLGAGGAAGMKGQVSSTSWAATRSPPALSLQ